MQFEETHEFLVKSAEHKKGFLNNREKHIEEFKEEVRVQKSTPTEKRDKRTLSVDVTMVHNGENLIRIFDAKRTRE